MSQQTENQTSQTSEDGSTPLAQALFGWTSKPYTKNLFFFGVGLLAIVLLVADFFVHRHAYKPVAFSEFNMFYGLYGFAAFTFVVLCGWPLGALLRRPENYYDPEVGSETDGEDA